MRVLTTKAFDLGEYDGRVCCAVYVEPCTEASDIRAEALRHLETENTGNLCKNRDGRREYIDGFIQGYDGALAFRRLARRAVALTDDLKTSALREAR